MKFKLVEHYVNCFDEETQLKYFEDVKRLIENAYAPLGGAKGIDKPDELMGKDIFWKLCRKNGKIVACAIYKIESGDIKVNAKVKMFDVNATNRKIKYVGQDGTKEGKNALMALLDEDIMQGGRGFWGEVSGKMEKIYINRGAIPIPNTIAEQVLIAADKSASKLDSDGYHYWRQIGTENPQLFRKMMIGNANVVNQSRQNNSDVIKLFDDAPEYEFED